MKNLFTLFTLLFLFSVFTKAQITVTASDLEAQLAIGKTVTTFNDRSTTSLNLGSTGSSSWDFSGLVQTDEFVTESKSVGSSPYTSDFPGAEYASNYQGTFEGVFSNTWVYNSIGENYVSHGTGTVTNTQAGPSTTKITFSPAQVEYKLPVEYQSTWNYQGQQTIATTITLPFVGDQTTTIVQQKTRNFTVDAYGLITLPGGKTLNALRIREEITLTGSGVNSSNVMYRFLTKTGESVNVTLADGVTANSGTVNISAVSWTTGDGTSVPTSVKEITGLPSNYTLSQNYPNPFNPSTQIQFSIPEQGYVSLKVFNTLGKEVAELVNQNLSARNYSVDFNASTLSSGIYFYTITTNNFSATKKMILVK